MFQPVVYGDLNSRQKENYNFQKVAARLADYGFNCLRLTDDWQGADFIACHIDGETFLKVQIKGRMVIDRKYLGQRHPHRLSPGRELLPLRSRRPCAPCRRAWPDRCDSFMGRERLVHLATSAVMGA